MVIFRCRNELCVRVVLVMYLVCFVFLVGWNIADAGMKEVVVTFDPETGRFETGQELEESDVPGLMGNTETISLEVQGEGSWESCLGIGLMAEDENRVFNSGSIKITVNGENTIRAYGIEKNIWATAPDAVPDSMTNSGTILVEVTGALAKGYGMRANVWGEDGGAGLLTNNGTIEVLAGGDDARAYGMVWSADEDGPAGTQICNEGAITVQAEGEMARAFGIETSQETVVSNAGTIQAATEGASAWSVGIRTGENSEITNSGVICAEVQGGDGTAWAVGIDAGAQSSVVNTGTIYVEASGSVAHSEGIYFRDGGSVVNSGSIFVDGADAAGIYAQGEVTISNSGFIYTSNGARAVELGASEAVLDGDFSLIFSGSPVSDLYVAPILLHSGGTLDLNGVSLVVSTGDFFWWDTPYEIIENDGGIVLGTFGELEFQVANPGVDVVWSGEDNGENASVSFCYDPEESAAALAAAATQQAVAGTLGMVRNRMTTMTMASLLEPETEVSRMLFADSGTIASDAGYGLGSKGRSSDRTIFVKPYLTTTNQPSDGGMGYDANTVGFIAGYDIALSPSLLLGLHGGVGQADIDFSGSGYDADSEDVDIYSLGAHGTWSLGNWHVQASTSFYAARHDYEGLTGLNLDVDEDDDYMSYGSETALTAGYGFRFGKMAFMPELGVAHSWIHGESHTSDADDAAWNTHYGSYDDHVFKSIVGGRLMGTWELGGAMVTPALGLRWEQALNDNSITVSQALPGTSSVSVSEDVADTSILGDATLKFARDNLSMELGFIQEYNDDYTATGGSVTFRWAF